MNVAITTTSTRTWKAVKAHYVLVRRTPSHEQRVRKDNVKLKLAVLIATAGLTLSSLVPVSTAFAHPGHMSCSDFGASVAADAPHGEVARQFAPLNDFVEGRHAAFCEPTV